jgi:hypothetical protein
MDESETSRLDADGLLGLFLEAGKASTAAEEEEEEGVGVVAAGKAAEFAATAAVNCSVASSLT